MKNTGNSSSLDTRIRLLHEVAQPRPALRVDKQFVRANQIARSRRTQNPLIDISIATWWRWVAAGIAPQPTRLSTGTTVWDLNEVLEFLQSQKDVKTNPNLPGPNKMEINHDK